jgi:Tol biopolymer transport system component
MARWLIAATLLLLGCGRAFEASVSDSSAPSAGGGGAATGGSGGGSGTVASSSGSGGSGGTSSGDAGGGGSMPLGLFGNVQPVDTLNSLVPDDDPTLTADMLEIYFESSRAPQLGGGDIFRATRATLASPWSAAEHMAGLSSTSTETTPEIAPDGLTIWVASNRNGQFDLYVATRSNRGAPWNAQAAVAELNSPGTDMHANVSSDGLFMMMVSDRSGAGGLDFFSTTRATTSSPWIVPVNVTALATAATETEPFFDEPRTTLWFGSDAPGGPGQRDLFVSERPDASAPWGAPTPMNELNTASNEGDPWVSPNGRVMYFSSDRDGTSNLYKATR